MQAEAVLFKGKLRLDLLRRGDLTLPVGLHTVDVDGQQVPSVPQGTRLFLLSLQEPGAPKTR